MSGRTKACDYFGCDEEIQKKKVVVLTDRYKCHCNQPSKIWSSGTVLFVGCAKGDCEFRATAV